MTAPPQQADVAELVRDLRETIRFARLGGASLTFTDTVAEQIVAALLELQEHRCGDRDPRRQRTLRLAKDVAYAHTGGASIAVLMQRFGRSRSQIHRLLGVARSHATKRSYASLI